MACNDWKIHLSFLSETAECGLHLYVRNIPGHHFTVRIHCSVDSIYNGFYIVVCCRVALRRHRSSAAALRVLPGDEPGRVEELRRTSALCRYTLRENKTSKQGQNTCPFVCVCVRFLHTSLTHSNIYSSTWQLQNFTTVNCTVISSYFCQLIELS